jgi:hypothetical protein
VLLRGSGEHDGIDYDLDAIVGDTAGDAAAPIAGGELLGAFAEAFYEGGAALTAARDALRGNLGDGCLVDAAATVGVFDAVVKIADSTGIPLEEEKAQMSEDIRESLGIDGFGPVVS